MNFSYFLASRVAATGQQSFSRVIIRIAVVAVALSMTVMVVATSLISGFKQEIAEKIFGFWGHIHITSAVSSQSRLETTPILRDQPFYPGLDSLRELSYVEYREVMGQEYDRQRTTQGGVRHVQVYALMPGIIKANEEIEGIVLKGIDRDFDWKFLSDYLVEGRTMRLDTDSMSRDIMISQYTSNRLKVEVDDNFIIYFVKNGETLQRRFNIVGIYKTGLEEYDRQFALVDIRQVQRLLGWRESEVGGFEVFVEHISDLDAIAEYIYIEELPSGLYAETIRQKVPEIFDWLDLQDINEAVILGLMLLVGIINMMTALLILILERTNMIGILKALGTSDWSVRRMFLYYAAYIILVGLFWGNLLGLLLCWVQDRFGLITLDEANYYLSVAPVSINWGTILLLNIGTLVITLFFLIIPSWLVTRISPVRSIRFK